MTTLPGSLNPLPDVWDEDFAGLLCSIQDSAVTQCRRPLVRDAVFLFDLAKQSRERISARLHVVPVIGPEISDGWLRIATEEAKSCWWKWNQPDWTTLDDVTAEAWAILVAVQGKYRAGDGAMLRRRIHDRLISFIVRGNKKHEHVIYTTGAALEIAEHDSVAKPSRSRKYRGFPSPQRSIDINLRILDAAERKAIDLVSQGADQGHIAFEMGCSQPTVSRILARAREKLRPSIAHLLPKAA